MPAARRGGGDERGRRAPSAREGGDGGEDGTRSRVGNTCRQPVMRGGRAAAAEGTVRPAGTSGPASGPSSTRLLSLAPTSRPLPEESSHRRPKDTAASRGPAPERAPPGRGRRRRWRETRDRKPDDNSRGASPAKPRGRVRREDAPRRGAAVTRRGRRSGIEGRNAGVPRGPRNQRTVLPREGGRPRPFPDDTTLKPRDGKPHDTPPGHPRSHLFLSPALRAPGGGGVDGGGGRSSGGHGARPRALDLRDPTRPAPRHAREPSLFPTWIPADRPAEARPRAGRVPPKPLNA